MASGLGCLGILLIPALGFAIAALVIALNLRRRVDQFDVSLAKRDRRIYELERQLATFVHVSPAGDAVAPAEHAVPPSDASAVEPPPPVERMPEASEPAAAPIVPQDVPPPFEPAPPPPLVQPAAAFEAAAPAEAPAETPPPPPPAPPRTEPPAPAGPGFDWEALIGVKLFSWIAGVALLLAAVFFLKYSVDHGWLKPPVRMAIGIVTGVGLLVVSQLKAANRYRITANALDAAGIAILYASFFASHALWHLLPSSVIFGAMVLVTIVAVRLSIVRDSIFISLLGLFGGFLTPWLLSTGVDRPVALFSYLLLLNAGLAWVAYKKRWPLLTGLTLVFTTIYQWGWVVSHLTPEKLPIAVAVFLSFPLLAVAALMLGSRGRDDDWKRVFERIGLLGAALPLLFAVYFAAVPGFGSRYNLLFGFLFCLAAGAAALAAARPAMRPLHALAAATAVLTPLVWAWGDSYASASWPASLAWTSALVILYLAAPMLAWRFGAAYEGAADRAVLAAPLLLVIFASYPLIEPKSAPGVLLFATLFVLSAACAAWSIRHGRGSVYFLASFFAVATEATWSTKFLEPQRLLTGLSVYAAFALLFIAVPVIARRMGRALEPARAASAVLFASIALLFFLAGGPVASIALWGIAIMLAVLNLGALYHAATTRGPLVAIAGALLSWIVLGVWWATVPVAVQIVPALVVVGAFAIALIAGSAWLQKSSDPDVRVAASASGSIYAGLVGHVFLAFVASQEALAVPPWPLFAILFVIDLAIAIAAFVARRPRLHVAAMIASQIILMLWAATATAAPWPSVSLLAAIAVSLFASGWMVLVRSRVTPERDPALHQEFTVAAVAALFLGHFVAVVASDSAALPSVHAIWGTHLVLAVGLLAIAAVSRWHSIAPFAVIPAALGVEAWRASASRPWDELFLFATVLYIPFIAYPLIVGRKAHEVRAPWVASIVASVAYFLFAREAIILGGYEYAIGLLPVVQAALLLVHVRQLLRIEAAGARDTGRLALVAAAALAFVTVAIPLQLEKEWITIGWALEGTALAWLYTRIRHRGLLYWCAALTGVVFVRLVVNPAIFDYHPRSATPILNWYLYTYLVAAVAFYAAAWIVRKSDDRLMKERLRLSPLLAGGGTALLFLLLNIQIADFYSTGPTLTFNFSAGLAQDLTYTLGWATFAIAMLIAGIYAGNRTTRVASLVLLVITILKCFMHDLWRVGGLYRVGSFVGLAVSLILVALLLQKFVMKQQPSAPKEQIP